MWKVLHSRWRVVLWVECSVLQWTVCGRYCTVCNWTVLTVIAHKLLLHVQLHNSTAHLLYIYFTNCRLCNGTVLTVITQTLLLHVQLTTAHDIYWTYSVQTLQSATELYLQYLHVSCRYMFSCTTAQHIYSTNSVQNCTVCNWTELTVITQKLLLHVQLHNRKAHLLYKFCTNSIDCNWTVLTVITQKLLLHVKLHNSTAHLLYKFYTNCTVCNWTVLTEITQKLLLHVQLHNSTAHLLYKLYSLQINCRYTSYTEAAATCSDAQQHITFNLQMVYKV